MGKTWAVRDSVNLWEGRTVTSGRATKGDIMDAGNDLCLDLEPDYLRYSLSKTYYATYL